MRNAECLMTNAECVMPKAEWQCRCWALRIMHFAFRISHFAAIELRRRADDAGLVPIEEPEIGFDAGPELEAFLALRVRVENRDEREDARLLPPEPARGGFDLELRGAQLGPGAPRVAFQTPRVFTARDVVSRASGARRLIGWLQRRRGHAVAEPEELPQTVAGEVDIQCSPFSVLLRPC